MDGITDSTKVRLCELYSDTLPNGLKLPVLCIENIFEKQFGGKSCGIRSALICMQALQVNYSIKIKLILSIYDI